MYSIDEKSVRKICGDSKYVVVYGYAGCHLKKVHRALTGLFLQAYDYDLGGVYYDGKRGGVYPVMMQADQRYFEQINMLKKSNIKRLCKAGLISVVFENMKRIEYGEPIIPVIFCIDATNKTITWNCDSENITAKNKIVLCDGRPQQMNTVITHAEIRIAYKLCSHEGVSLKIQNAAQKTFKFVKVEETNYKWKLVLVKAPWQAEDFSSKWQARMAISEGEKKVKAKNWIGQLREQEEAFFLAREQIMRPIASAKEENLEPAAASVAPEALDAQMGASSLVMIPPVPRQQNSSKKPAWYSCFACSAALEA